MDRTKGLAYCGLACCVCGENANCAGCKMGGCENMEWCKIWKCCKEKGISSCSACEGFPCGDPMLSKFRVRAFLRFAAQYGEDKLMDALERREREDVRYHYAGEHVGDYDKFASEDELLDFLRGALNDKQ